jgi:hypothetical protein
MLHRSLSARAGHAPRYTHARVRSPAGSTEEVESCLISGSLIYLLDLPSSPLARRHYTQRHRGNAAAGATEARLLGAGVTGVSCGWRVHVLYLLVNQQQWL